MALQVAERLGKEIQALSFSYEGQAFSVTISQGLASLTEADSTLDSLFARADAAMYEAKRLGKTARLLKVGLAELTRIRKT